MYKLKREKLDKFQKEAYFLLGYIGSHCQLYNHHMTYFTKEDMNYIANRLRKLCDGQKLQLKNGKLPIPHVSGSLLLELALRTRMVFPLTEEEEKIWDTGLDGEVKFLEKLDNQLDIVRSQSNDR